jgi:hypothetical protein
MRGREGVVERVEKYRDTCLLADGVSEMESTPVQSILSSAVSCYRAAVV